MTTIENWNSPREKSVILFYPCANVNFRWQSCISQPDQKRHSWLLFLFLDSWVFTSFAALTQFLNVNAIVDTRSSKKTNFLKDEENSPNHTFMWKRVRVLAPSIIILMESLRRPFLCSCNQICAMTNTGAWDVGDTGFEFLLNLFMRTTHFTLSCPDQAVNAPVEVEQCHTEHTFGGALSSSWIVGTWLGAVQDVVFAPSITGIVSSTQVKEGHKPPAQDPQVW